MVDNSSPLWYKSASYGGLSKAILASFISQFTLYALTLTLSSGRGDFFSLALWGEGRVRGKEEL